MKNIHTEETGDLLQQIATELAFVETGSAASLATIAALLAELEKLTGTPVPPPIALEIATAAQFAEAVDAAGGALAADAMPVLQKWYERLDKACQDWLAAPDAPAAQEPTMTVELGEDTELLNEFCNEGKDLLQDIEQGVLVLEENPTSADTLNVVFRAFHTFKGGAGFLGLEPIKNLAHELESLLDAARRGDLTIDTYITELILAGRDALQQFLSEIGKRLGGALKGEAITVPTSDLIARVKARLAGENPLPAAKPQPVAAVAQPVAAVAQPVAAVAPPVAAVAQPVAAVAQPPAKSAPVASKTNSNKSSAGSSNERLASFVKLDTQKLDVLVDLVGELVIAQSMVLQHPQVQTLNDRNLARFMRQLHGITTDLQHNAMSLRMVEVRGAFQKMNRLVRDLSGAQGKQVQLVLSGEETEIDRNIVEELGDPLVHMVRNSVDHGIEMPEVRVAQGKPALGTVRLHAMHSGGGIVITISDDGKGLDKNRILAKAIQRGLIDADATPTEKEIFDLIFLPGFSTVDNITDISGRGVGMDVVRASISRLRGRVEVQSTLGQGSVVTIRLPLTMAIIDGMLIGIGTERFIIPSLSIRESFRPLPGVVATSQGRGEVVSVRGKLIPLVRLGDQLGIESTAKDPCDGIIVVTQSESQPRGLLVDRLIGKQEVVIKSLGSAFKGQASMSGAAILGDGLVALILDIENLGAPRAHHKNQPVPTA
ncbi:MAG: hypothetical protein RLY92_939 [Chloroflexota bacterium]